MPWRQRRPYGAEVWARSWLWLTREEFRGEKGRGFLRETLGKCTETSGCWNNPAKDLGSAFVWLLQWGRCSCEWWALGGWCFLPNPRCFMDLKQKSLQQRASFQTAFSNPLPRGRCGLQHAQFLYSLVNCPSTFSTTPQISKKRAIFPFYINEVLPRGL